MVAGEPYYSQKAPSHVERANRQREKGKGWQRSKSSMNEYGESDLYFSEDRAMRPSHNSVGSIDPYNHYHSRGRRSHSSMSGRRNEKNTNFYEIECPAKRQPRRRPSIPAIVEATRSESSKVNVRQKTGPPEQTRLRTVPAETSRPRLTSNKALYGSAVISKDQNLQEPKINDGFCLAAKDYSPRHPNSNAEVQPFSSREDSESPFSYGGRKMDMLITTGDFAEFASVLDKDLSIKSLEWSGEHYKHRISTTQDENSRMPMFIDVLHLELQDDVVPLNRYLKGRVNIELKRPAKIDSIILEVNNIKATTTTKGDYKTYPRLGSGLLDELKVLPNKAIHSEMDDEELDEPRPQRGSEQDFDPNSYKVFSNFPQGFLIPAGKWSFDFELYVPRKEFPSFTFVNKNGSAAFNNYSVDCLVSFNKKPVRIGKLPFKVPALGWRKQPVGTKNPIGLKRYIVSPSQYFIGDKENGVEYVIGQSSDDEDDQPLGEVTATIQRVISCPDIGDVDETSVAIVPANKASGSSSPVLTKYRSNTNNLKFGEDWDNIWSGQSDFITSDVPSVYMPGFFTCDYKLLVKTAAESYKATIIKCDCFDDSRDRRPELSPDAKKKTFEVT